MKLAIFILIFFLSGCYNQKNVKYTRIDKIIYPLGEYVIPIDSIPKDTMKCFRTAGSICLDTGYKLYFYNGSRWVKF